MNRLSIAFFAAALLLVGITLTALAVRATTIGFASPGAATIEADQGARTIARPALSPAAVSRST